MECNVFCGLEAERYSIKMAINRKLWYTTIYSFTSWGDINPTPPPITQVFEKLTKLLNQANIFHQWNIFSIVIVLTSSEHIKISLFFDSLRLAKELKFLYFFGSCPHFAHFFSYKNNPSGGTEQRALRNDPERTNLSTRSMTWSRDSTPTTNLILNGLASNLCHWNESLQMNVWDMRQSSHRIQFFYMKKASLLILFMEKSFF